MLSRFRRFALTLAAAGSVALLSLVPAAAQGAHTGSPPGYGMACATCGYSAPRYGYGSSSRPGYGYGYGSQAYGGAYLRRYYKVVRGDTLLKIARRFGVSVQALLAANPGIRNPNLIYAGQWLVIPAYGTGGHKIPGYTAPYGSSGAYGAPGAAAGANAYATPAAPSGGTPESQATPAPQATPESQAAPAPGSSAAMTQTVTLNLTAHNMAFDRSTLTVPAGAHVVVNFNNTDAVPHTFSVYTDASAQQAIFKGQAVTGPATTTYEFDAPAQPGTYFFRCDVHPTIMKGQFIAQ